MKVMHIIGNITADCKIHEGRGGQSQSATFSVAVGDDIKKDAPATFFGCRTYQQGVFQFLKKGKQVAVLGDFYTTRSDDGKTWLNLNVKSLKLLGGGERRNQQSQEDNAFSDYNKTKNDMDDEIPW